METIKAWQCIGCGKLEAPQTCIGICQDRRVELVYASEYDALESELAHARAERDALAAFAQRVVALPGEDPALRALRADAQAALAPPPPAATAPTVARADDGVLRDRRGARDEAADARAPGNDAPATGTTVDATAGNDTGATVAIATAAAGQDEDKPRLRRPSTLYVR